MMDMRWIFLGCQRVNPFFSRACNFKFQMSISPKSVRMVVFNVGYVDIVDILGVHDLFVT
jgi:hypothetical protein